MEITNAHVQFQLDNLKTYPAVSDGLASGKAAIHRWLYNMECCEVMVGGPQLNNWRELMQLAAT
jgi:carbonic anhydrase